MHGGQFTPQYSITTTLSLRQASEGASPRIVSPNVNADNLVSSSLALRLRDSAAKVMAARVLINSFMLNMS